jgi:hypothetical protein
MAQQCFHERKPLMPQLIFLAAVGAGAYAGYRFLKTIAQSVTADLEKATVETRERARAGDAKDLGVLEYDPKTGVYKPRID